MKTSKASIRDIAQQAGVSLGTVSNVLNHPERVSERNRKRVLDAMKRTRYIPSRAASQLRGRKSALVGVAVPDVGNLYWASVLRGIERVCDEAGMDMIVSSIHQDSQRQRRVFSNLMRQGVDGLIVAPVDVLSDDLLEFRSRLGIVSIGSSPKVPHVGVDAEGGMRQAAEHLLELGHRRIGMINGRGFVSWCAARRSGVVTAMESHGLESERCFHEYVVDDMTVDKGHEGARALLEGDSGITALVCANDALALGALLEAKAMGVRVPDDLSIIGYDDVEFAAALSPALTTVRQTSYELGVRAARLLLADELDSCAADEGELPAPRLIIRESSGPARAVRK